MYQSVESPKVTPLGSAYGTTSKSVRKCGDACAYFEIDPYGKFYCTKFERDVAYTDINKPCTNEY